MGWILAKNTRENVVMITKLIGVAGSVAFIGTLALSQESSRPPSVVIPADQLEIKLGDPLSARALVTKPPTLTGAVSWSLETRRHRGTFWCQALSPDGKMLATGGLDGTIRIWDVETGRLLRALIGHNSYVYGLDWSPDGNSLASAGAFDATVRLWDTRTGRPLKILRGHPAYLVQVKWAPGGKAVLAAGGESGPITHWNAIFGTRKGTVELGRYVTGLAWHPDGKTAAAISQPLALQIWDAEKNKIVRTFGLASDHYLSVCWSPDGKTLAAGAAKNTLLYDQAGKVVQTLKSSASQVAWSSDNKQVFTLTDAIKVWDAASGSLLRTIPTPGANAFAITPDGKQFVSGGTSFFAVNDAVTGKLVRRFDNLSGTVPPLWWPGKPLVTGVGTAKLSLWDQANGKLLCSLEGHTSSISAVTYSPDGKTLASASYDKTVRLWDVASGKQTQLFSGHSAPVLAVAFAANGKLLASGGADKKVLIWDAKSAKVQQTLKGHEQEVTALAWAPTSSVSLASGGKEGAVHIWNAKTGKDLKKLFKRLEGINEIVSLTWSKDGNQVVGGQGDHRVQIWQLPAGKLIHTLEEGGSPPQVTSLAFSPNGSILAAGRGNHTMQLWNPKSGKKLHSLQTMAPVQRVSWTPGSTTVVASNHERSARFYDALTGQLRGVFLAEDEQILAISNDGHFRAPNPDPELVYVVQTGKSQDTYTLSEFSNKFRWKNVPAKVKLAGK
jgi:WD40 repeat protein